MPFPAKGLPASLFWLALLSGVAHADDLALCNAARGEEAVSACSRLIAAKPNLGIAHLKRGVALFRLGRLEEARRDMERAARLRPDDPDPPFNLGAIAQRGGDSGKARAHYAKALEIDPGHQMAQNALKRLTAFDAAEEKLRARMKELQQQ